MAQRHLIGKQVWEIGIRSSRDGHVLQQKVSDLVWKDLAPELNRMFDRMVSPDQLLRLDRVELDLGDIDLKEASRTQLIERIVKSLEDWCFRAKILPADKSVRDADSWKHTPEIPLSHHYFEIWLHWLRTGALPSYTLVPESDWIDKVLETLVLDRQAIDLLREVVMGHPVRLRRLILQLSHKDLKSIVEVYTGHPQTLLMEILEEISLLLGSNPELVFRSTEREIEVEIWTLVLRGVILQQKRSTSDEISKELFGTSFLWPLVKAVRDMHAEEAVRYPLLQQVIKEIPGVFSAQESKDRFIAQEIEQEASEAAEFNMESIDEQEIPLPQFFANAGVVLLHPFLKHLFKRLQLLKGNAFRNQQCQSKAILLMQYLATGDEKVEDYALVLPKFLCGMPANWPMDHTMTLTKKAIQYANELLQAAIDHWGALGNTSIDGLREGFLVREGKLEQEESGWKLYVEHKAMDVLLDRLPWNLSLIKLPWMKELLNVEWR